MVGIYEYKFGLKLIAVSENEESAKRAIYDRKCEEFNRYLYNYDYNEYWNKQAKRFYEIRIIENGNTANAVFFIWT